MTRPLPLEAWFDRRRAARRPAFMPYVTAGHPSLQAMPEVLSLLRDAGADCVELGVPFSDPVADGVTIQSSSQAALAGGATLEKCLRAAEAGARRGLRVVLMSYANPVLQAGPARAARRFAAAGAQGLIVPDLPLEESAAWSAACASEGVALVLMAAPTTPGPRLRAIASASRGFLYYVSLTGVTGERRSLPAGLAGRLAALRRASPRAVCVGFGVSTPAQARRIANRSDGVIVGSAMVRRLAAGWGTRGGRAEIARWTASLARAVHRG